MLLDSIGRKKGFNYINLEPKHYWNNLTPWQEKHTMEKTWLGKKYWIILWLHFRSSLLLLKLGKFIQQRLNFQQIYLNLVIFTVHCIPANSWMHPSFNCSVHTYFYSGSRFLKGFWFSIFHYLQDFFFKFLDFRCSNCHINPAMRQKHGIDTLTHWLMTTLVFFIWVTPRKF